MRNITYGEFFENSNRYLDPLHSYINIKPSALLRQTVLTGGLSPITAESINAMAKPMGYQCFLSDIFDVCVEVLMRNIVPTDKVQAQERYMGYCSSHIDNLLADVYNKKLLTLEDIADIYAEMQYYEEQMVNYSNISNLQMLEAYTVAYCIINEKNVRQYMEFLANFSRQYRSNLRRIKDNIYAVLVRDSAKSHIKADI